MYWILLDNKPLRKITEQHTNINDKLEILLQKIDGLEKQNKNLEQFLIHSQKLYMKQFNIICDMLQENRSLYMKEFQHELEDIQSLKPILQDIKETNHIKVNMDNEHDSSQTIGSNEQTIMARLNNLLWRSRNRSPKNIAHLTTTPDNKIVSIITKEI